MFKTFSIYDGAMQMEKHFTLHAALHHLDPTRIVVAQDVSKNGQKVFYCANVQQLDALYTHMDQKHWYECLVEERASRIFLDIESYDKVDLDAILAFLRTCVQEKFGVAPELAVLDSCSADKQSWHVLVLNVYVTNVYHVGAFVRRMVLAALYGQRLPPPEINAIDTAVYTKNRMFRVAHSSKFGSERVLKHAAPWHQLLVQSYDAECAECLEIDNSTPVSTSQRPENMFERTAQGWRALTSVRRTNKGVASSCPMLDPILDWLDRHIDGRTCRHNSTMTSTGHYRVSTRSKCCRIAQREHRGNNIWYDILFEQQVVHQRCFDEDCRHKWVAVDIPKDVWTKWNTAWQQNVHAPINKKTLFNMSY